MSFQNKVVIVTGASSGIGRATAIQFAEQGAKLTITGRNEEALHRVAEECESMSEAKPLVVIAEMKEEQDVKNIIDSTIQEYGALHILVNNAATLELGGIEYTSLQQYDNVFNVNVRAIYQLCMLAVPHLVKTKGNIVNVSSINALVSYPFSLAYNMSKAALDQLTKCMSIELGYRNIRVNSVNPGIIKTEFLKRGGINNTMYNKVMEYGKKTHPYARLGEADDVARVVLFLASEDSFFMNGCQVPVDGGRHCLAL
ncbi:hypothetical protein U1Q18_042314 [Sarracenia purpurea var. burkii]